MGHYSVRKGDTLSSLAKKFNTTVEHLQELNNIKNPNSIFIGQNIKFDQELCSEWQDLDGDNKVSWGDFQGCGDYGVFLDKVTSFIGQSWNDKVRKKIQEIYTQSVSTPDKAILQGVNINNNSVKYNANPNFYRNNLDRDFAQFTLNDNNASSSVLIAVNFGKEIDSRDRKVSDFLKKVLGDNLDNTSQIIQTNGKFSTKTIRMENTDLYKSFVSPDVNPDMFTKEQFGKYQDDVFKPGFSGRVQLPALEMNENGVKYFTLHKRNGEILYFDETGNKVSSLDDIRKKIADNKMPDIQEMNVAKMNHSEKIFNTRKDFNNSKLNIGNVYIDGNPVEEHFNSNYYANGLDKTVGVSSLNTEEINKIQVELKAGDKINNKYDLSAGDILKKFLGDNLDNTTILNGNKIEGKKLQETDLYRVFLELNPELKDFKPGDQITVQMPAMKVAPNGERYFILLTQENQPIYFDAKGNL